MTLQEAKDQTAKQVTHLNGQSSSYKDWQEMEQYLMQNDCVHTLLERSNKAAELYARSKWDDACAFYELECMYFPYKKPTFKP